MDPKASSFILKFLKFGITGFIGMVVDFGVTYLLKEKAKWNKYLANTTGFILAVVNNYILNRVWTFKSTNPQWLAEFEKFLFLSIIGLCINNLIIYLLTEKRKTNFYIAKAIAVVIVVLWNFFSNYFFTFRLS